MYHRYVYPRPEPRRRYYSPHPPYSVLSPSSSSEVWFLNEEGGEETSRGTHLVDGDKETTRDVSKTTKVGITTFRLEGHL